MKTLQDYTDEELREELKRRAQERRKNQQDLIEGDLVGDDIGRWCVNVKEILQ